MRRLRFETPVFLGTGFVAALLELMLLGQMNSLQHARDFTPSPEFALLNLCLAGLALLLGLLLTRSQAMVHRLFGYCVCLYPAFVLAVHAVWAHNLVTSH